MQPPTSQICKIPKLHRLQLPKLETDDENMHGFLGEYLELNALSPSLTKRQWNALACTVI